MLQKASHAISRYIRESKKSFLHIIFLFIVNKINSVPTTWSVKEVCSFNLSN